MTFPGRAADHQEPHPQEAREDSPNCADQSVHDRRTRDDEILLDEEARLNGQHAAAFVVEYQGAAVEAERVGDDLVVAVILGEMLPATGPLGQIAHVGQRHKAHFGWW